MDYNPVSEERRKLFSCSSHTWWVVYCIPLLSDLGQTFGTKNHWKDHQIFLMSFSPLCRFSNFHLGTRSMPGRKIVITHKRASLELKSSFNVPSFYCSESFTGRNVCQQTQLRVILRCSLFLCVKQLRPETHEWSTALHWKHLFTTSQSLTRRPAALNTHKGAKFTMKLLNYLTENNSVPI